VYRPVFSSDSEAWANVAGGRSRGLVYTGLLTFGAHLDLEALDGGPGGELGIVGLGIYGGNVSPELVGDLGIISNIAGVSTVRLFKAWYRRRFLDDALDVKAGVLPVDEDFAVLDTALLFINSGFGTIQTLALNTPTPIYPNGVLGLRARMTLPGGVELQLGAYDGDAGDPTQRRHVSELSWSRDGGGFFVGELGWLPSSSVRLAVGGAYHSGRVSADRAALSLGYVMAEADLGGTAGSRWSVLSHASVAGPEPATVDAYADVGVVVTGGAWSRADDQLGVGVAWTRFSGARTTPSRLARSGEIVAELTYRAALWSWLFVQPDLQWHRNPGGRRADALVAGLRVRASL